MPSVISRSLLFFLLSACCAAAEPESQPLYSDLAHLRVGEQREWSDFPESATGNHLEIKFNSTSNKQEHALRLRQQDVKQAWRVLLNQKPLGDLITDERDATLCFAIPVGTLQDGENVLRIEPRSARPPTSDDIRVGQVRVDSRPVKELLTEATVEIAVIDGDSGERLPCCLTIVDEHGSLSPVGATSNDHLAVRMGTIYTSLGAAKFGLPAGRYTVYAGRGFEYSLAKAEITVARGDTIRQQLSIRREVPVPGYVACDTHIHTLTFSGHGDSTIDERMVTLAGEGIELPIATDHNVHIDYEPHARRLGVRKYFTPVMGNEFTTKVGHFNIFPIDAAARVPDAKLTDWKAIFPEIFATPGVKVAILNHARDVHSGVRPFGPTLFNAAVAENLEGWPMRFNAMEVINSGATQTDILRLFRDWMSLLNRGYTVTPVGSSDSHDVTRYLVGQGRTYIRCDDRDPSRIDVASAVDSFLAGRVLVSYGLVAELKINGKYAPGDFATQIGDEVKAEITVRGPHWVSASKVQLYANGQLLREELIPADSIRDLPAGVKWQGAWTIPKPAHDVHLVAIAIGPGIPGPYWLTAKAYQPTSPDWTPHTIGCSGAVWIDADADGRKSPARDYAEKLWKESGAVVGKVVASLRSFDAATASHVAHLYHSTGGSIDAPELEKALKDSPDHVRQGFRAYFEAWRECELARAK